MKWKVSNNCYMLYDGKTYKGMVSQNSPGTMDEGLWNVAFKTSDDGLISFGKLDYDKAIAILTNAARFNLTYDEWQSYYTKFLGMF